MKSIHQVPGKTVRLSKETIRRLKWSRSNDPQCEHTGIIKRIIQGKTIYNSSGVVATTPTVWKTVGYRCSACDAVHYLGDKL